MLEPAERVDMAWCLTGTIYEDGETLTHIQDLLSVTGAEVAAQGTTRTDQDAHRRFPLMRGGIVLETIEAMVLWTKISGEGETKLLYLAA